HTLNIRLFPSDLTYIINHAEDEVIFVDRSLISVLWPVMPTLTTVKHIVLMDDGQGDVPDDPRIVNYESLMADVDPIDFGVIVDLMESERVTFAGGVPSIWMGALPLLEGRDMSSLRIIISGGSAVPKALSQGMQEKTGLPITQAWGMTETSPLASICTIKSYL